MAFQIRRCDCDCGSQSDPCTPCIACSGLECRTRGGTATLCGFSEYASASTPPKKYRTQTLSGQWRTCNNNAADAGCTNQQDLKDREVYSGTYSYNGTTCATTNAQVANYYADGTDDQPCDDTMPFVSTSTPSASFAPSFLPAGKYVQTTTKTTNNWDFNGVACYDLGGGNGWRLQSGSVTAALTTEDTEADAITRLLAGAGGTWGSWITSGAVGCTGTPPSCCLAQREARTTGFSFIYQESQFRVVKTGLTAGVTYGIQVKIYRRTYGSGSYALYQTLTVTATADGSGNATFSGDVTNDSGYESYASCS
jgi:hypothetical protein